MISFHLKKSQIVAMLSNSLMDHNTKAISTKGEKEIRRDNKLGVMAQNLSGYGKPIYPMDAEL